MEVDLFMQDGYLVSAHWCQIEIARTIPVNPMGVPMEIYPAAVQI